MFNTLAESFFYFLYKCKLRKQFISSKCAIWNQKLNVNFRKSKLQEHTFHKKNQSKIFGIKKKNPACSIHGVSVCIKQKDLGAQHSAPADCCHPYELSGIQQFVAAEEVPCLTKKDLNSDLIFKACFYYFTDPTLTYSYQVIISRAAKCQTFN